MSKDTQKKNLETNNLKTNVIDLTDEQQTAQIKNQATKLAITEIEELKGEDLLLLDVTQITSLSDYILIVTGRSSTHCKSLAQNLRKQAKENNLPILGYEADPQSEWILLDLGDIIIHVMQQQTREYYALEKLWQIALDQTEINRNQ